MLTSEIDDIFASKGTLHPPAPAKASSSSSLPPLKEKKSKKKSKGKDGDKSLKRNHEEVDDAPAPAKPAKRKVPETVFDPSAFLPSAKQSKTAKAERVSAVKPKKPKVAREDEDRFKDSRGTGPRESFHHVHSLLFLRLPF